MNLKGEVYRIPGHDAYGITFWYWQGDKVYVAKPVTLEFELRDEGTSVDPFLTITGPMAFELRKSIEEMVNRQDFFRTRDAKVQGTLDATKYHLEDLRNLLKLTK